MELNPYLSFTGNAEAALEHYRNALGGDLEIMRYGGTPAAEYAPPDWSSKVLHGTLRSPAGVLMASDATEDRVKNPGDNFHITVRTETEAEADAVFAKLGTGGTVTMPLEATFFSAKFGMLIDKFGISWIVNCGLS